MPPAVASKKSFAVDKGCVGHNDQGWLSQRQNNQWRTTGSGGPCKL